MLVAPVVIDEMPRVHGWLIGVTLQDGVDPSTLSLCLADAIAPFGEASVEYLGTIELGPEVDAEANVKLN